MRRAASLFLLRASIAYAASDSSRPRGVGPDFAKFYKDDAGFTCISNPSVHLSLSQVNDDYCDCPDGSDEPGTSACSYLSPLSPSSSSDLINDDDANSSVALPGFYCKNKGHQPSYVPFTNVNDGICDYDLCCDGSEEWQGVGGVICKDRCEEIGKEWRKHNEARLKVVAAANKKRKDLVARAASIRKDVEYKIQSLESQIGNSEQRVSSLEADLAEAERRERGQVVKGGSAAKTGKLGVLVGLAQQRTTELRDSLMRLRQERDIKQERVQELEAILSAFKDEYNPNFNDEGVKRAVRSWEDYAARDRADEGEAALERDLDEITKSDADNGIIWEDYVDEADGDNTDVLYDIEMYLPKSLRTWVDQKLRDFRVMLIENGILADLKAEGSDSRAVTDARKRLEDAQKELNSGRDSLRSNQEDLERDYGPDDIFRAFKGQCISTDSGEYTYELCWMDKTSQKSKKNGGNTNLGSFVRMEKSVFDEELPTDGRGVGSGERIVMRYENGQQCWNGPHRSTTVVLACAEKEEIWRIIEEQKCVYRMEVGTPAVCDAASSGKAAVVKDEL